MAKARLGDRPDGLSRFRQAGAAASIAAACCALAACGGAPSESDLRSAVDKQVRQQAQTLEALVGKAAASKAPLPEIKSFRKIGCAADGASAYRCDVEVEVSQMGMTNKATRTMRFVKGSDGWAVAG